MDWRSLPQSPEHKAERGAIICKYSSQRNLDETDLFECRRLILASSAADWKKTRCTARGWKSKIVETREKGREEERLTLTPSGFLFSRLLAAVEKEQEGGKEEKGGAKKMN